MREILLSSIFLMTGLLAFSQNGLEKIIVEKYYVSDENDAKAKKGGNLPPGSVTYRIYADMLPSYRFQACYGVENHELKFATTTAFFNNEIAGAIVANDIPVERLKESTIMLDSWLSVAAASHGNFGIPKEEDTEVGTIVNIDNFLQSEHPDAGIPVKKRDGFKSAYPQLAVNFYGLDTLVNEHFGNKNRITKGQTFSSYNGSWYAIAGSVGPIEETNRVLIAQITTDGAFTFELNIQILKPEGGVENYVAKNPLENEIMLPSLTYSSAKEKTGSVKRREQ